MRSVFEGANSRIWSPHHGKPREWGKFRDWNNYFPEQNPGEIRQGGPGWTLSVPPERSASSALPAAGSDPAFQARCSTRSPGRDNRKQSRCRADQKRATHFPCLTITPRFRAKIRDGDVRLSSLSLVSSLAVSEPPEHRSARGTLRGSNRSSIYSQCNAAFVLSHLADRQSPDQHPRRIKTCQS